MRTHKTNPIWSLTSFVVIVTFLASMVSPSLSDAHENTLPGGTSTVMPSVVGPVSDGVLVTRPTDSLAPLVGPHSDDPVKHDEHEALFELVEDEHASLVVDSDKKLSELGIKDGEQIVIKEGVTVLVDEENLTKINWIRVDGTLKFATDRNTSLKVVTLVVNTKGYLEIGSATQRVQADHTAKIVIADRGVRDVINDPMDFTGGLISHGKVRMYGAEYQSHVELTNQAKKGDSELVLANPNASWKVGDIIVLAGTNPNAREDEELKITEISEDGLRLKFSAVDDATNNILKFDHDLSIPIGNLTRNVIIASENAEDISRRGHVMFMHSKDVEIDSAGFYGLGRTDARQAVTDPVLDSEGNLVPGSDANTRGRYAVHFHVRTGAKLTDKPSIFRNSSIVDSPKFGLVNHGSYVIAENNVTYDIDGSHFFMENGSEIGTVQGNLGIYSRGNAFLWKDPDDPNAKVKVIRDGQESRKDIFDFGFEGHFLWAQGGGVEVYDNFATGQASVAYIFFTTTIKEGGKDITFLVDNLRNGALKDDLKARNRTTIDVGSVPFVFARNKATASGGGFETKFHLLNVKNDRDFSLVEESVFWNNRGAASRNEYTNQLHFRDVTLLGNENNPQGAALERNDVTRSLIYENMTIRGFKYGIQVPVNGHNFIIGGTLNNVVNIYITTTRSQNRTVDIDDSNLVFETLSEAALKKSGVGRQYDIYMKSDFRPRNGDISVNFEPDVVTARGDSIRLGGKQIFFEEQAGDYVPFKRVLDSNGKVIYDTLTGTELDNLTSRQMWDLYRLAIGGVVAPVDAVRDPRIRGLIGDPVAYDPRYTLMSSRFTNQSLYTLKLKDSQGKFVILEAQTLKPNAWNLVSVKIDGLVRTVLIYQDSIAPEFIPNENMMNPQNFRIHPEDIAYGFKIKGLIKDQVGNITATQPFEKVYKLAKDPTNPKDNEFVISADGKAIVINVRIKDMAGNITVITYNIKIDSDAPRRRANVGFFDQPSFGKKLPVRVPNRLLKLLLGITGVIKR